jgi:hypothetical protein
MSEFVSVETVYSDVESLVDALVECGINKTHIEVHDSPKPLVGYQSDERVQKAEVIIRRQHVGSASNDIGFEKQADGKYKAWVSEFDRNRGLGAKIASGKLTQIYAKNKILKTVKMKRGQKVTSCEEKGGKIKIKVRVS